VSFSTVDIQEVIIERGCPSRQFGCELLFSIDITATLMSSVVFETISVKIVDYSRCPISQFGCETLQLFGYHSHFDEFG
jgi:hypothetical protein